MNEIIKKEKIIGYVETLIAIELLQYHNKIYLSYDNGRLNEEKRKLLNNVLIYLKEEK